MKKIILCFGLLALSLTSCSDDSSDPVVPNPNPSDGVLVQQVVYNNLTDDFSETVNYTYNGNKLVTGVYDDGTVETYTYEGDLITKVELTDGDDVISTETFDYDSNGRLVEYNFVDLGFEEQETFVYNSDGTVTQSIDGGPGRTFHFLNDELIKIVDADGRTYNYTYDAKNSPFRNVTGYSKIVHVLHGDHEFFGRWQNISMIHEQTNDIDYMTNTMTYNSDNYPTFVNSVAIFEGDGTYNVTLEYTY